MLYILIPSMLEPCTLFQAAFNAVHVYRMKMTAVGHSWVLRVRAYDFQVPSRRHTRWMTQAPGLPGLRPSGLPGRPGEQSAEILLDGGSDCVRSDEVFGIRDSGSSGGAGLSEFGSFGNRTE
jgi:hypothetical protein